MAPIPVSARSRAFDPSLVIRLRPTGCPRPLRKAGPAREASGRTLAGAPATRVGPSNPSRFRPGVVADSGGGVASSSAVLVTVSNRRADGKCRRPLPLTEQEGGGVPQGLRRLAERPGWPLSQSLIRPALLVPWPNDRIRRRSGRAGPPACSGRARPPACLPQTACPSMPPAGGQAVDGAGCCRRAQTHLAAVQATVESIPEHDAPKAVLVTAKGTPQTPRFQPFAPSCRRLPLGKSDR